MNFDFRNGPFYSAATFAEKYTAKAFSIGQWPFVVNYYPNLHQASSRATPYAKSSSRRGHGAPNWVVDLDGPETTDIGWMPAQIVNPLGHGTAAYYQKAAPRRRNQCLRRRLPRCMALGVAAMSLDLLTQYIEHALSLSGWLTPNRIRALRPISNAKPRPTVVSPQIVPENLVCLYRACRRVVNTPPSQIAACLEASDRRPLLPLRRPKLMEIGCTRPAPRLLPDLDAWAANCRNKE